MKKLIDIMRLKASDEEVLNLDTVWRGRILMDDDFSFEGVVFDNGDKYPYQYDYIVGKIDMSVKPATIDLIKTVDHRLPIRYTLFAENRSFYGDYFEASAQSCTLGLAKVNMLDGDKIREVSDEEIVKVSEEIGKAKMKLDPISMKIIAESMGIDMGEEECKQYGKSKFN